MGQIPEIMFSMIATQDCNTITVVDSTLYNTEEFPVLREDVACMIFWNKIGNSDINGCAINAPMANSIHEFSLTFLEQGDYSIFFIIATEWASGMSIPPHQTICYNNAMYYNNTLGNLTSTPGSTVDWTNITCQGGLIKQAITNSKYENKDYFYAGGSNGVYRVKCSPGILLNTECNKYVVQSYEFLQRNNEENYTPENLNPILVKVWNLNKTEIIGCYYIDLYHGETMTEFELPEDNVYLVEIGYGYYNYTIENNVIVDVTINNNCLFMGDKYVTEEYIVYGICNIETCYNSLLMSLLCNPIDPCCDSCDAETKEMMDNKRYTLNMMNALWYNLLAYIEIEKYQYLGIRRIYEINGEVVDIERNKYLSLIYDTIEKIKEISQRCGDCNGTYDNTNCKEC